MDLPGPPELLKGYSRILDSQRLQWAVHHRLSRLLGTGGQGVVYLSERRGADGFSIPVAIKIFSPAGFENEAAYSEAMGRLARVSRRIAQIQHDNLLDIHNFVDRGGIRILVMEWIDGYDLRQLISLPRLNQIKQQVNSERWDEINRGIITAGEKQSRLRTGVTIAIVRHCLAGLGSLHQHGIIHGDIKPSNVMVKRSGLAKIIDTGSAYALDDLPTKRTCTPVYAAPEVLAGSEPTAQSDLASLGYVLVEVLSGRCPFSELPKYSDLVEAKRRLPEQLEEILPKSVLRNQTLMAFCRQLIAVDPADRFESAEAAELLSDGAAEIQRQLVLNEDNQEYDHEIHLLIEELKELDNQPVS